MALTWQTINMSLHMWLPNYHTHFGSVLGEINRATQNQSPMYIQAFLLKPRWLEFKKFKNKN